MSHCQPLRWLAARRKVKKKKDIVRKSNGDGSMVSNEKQEI